MTSELCVRTWNDLARAAVWYAQHREITFDEADYLLWERTCFPMGSLAQIENQLAEAVSGGA